jgi:hypothetical protein
MLSGGIGGYLASIVQLLLEAGNVLMLFSPRFAQTFSLALLAQYSFREWNTYFGAEIWVELRILYSRRLLHTVFHQLD